MKTFRIFLTVWLFLTGPFFSQIASADGVGRLALTYDSHSSTDNGTTTTTSRTIYDLSLYYHTEDGWVLGALYQNDVQTSGSSVVRTSYGPSLGWMTNKESGLYLIGTYFTSSTYGDDKNGNGYQVDLGYKVKAGVPLAFQLSYKSYKYPDNDHSDTFVDPYFVVMANF